MKITVILFTLACFIATAAFGSNEVYEDSTLNKPKKKFVRIHFPPKDWVWLELYHPGAIHLIQKTTVPGTMTVETEGIRFTPITVSPEGYLPQKNFDKYFRYNSMMKELLLPFSKIRSVNIHYRTIKMKDGRKYRFYARKFRDRFGSKIRSEIQQ